MKWLIGLLILGVVVFLVVCAAVVEYFKAMEE